MMTTRTEAAESINATIDGDYVYYHDDATNDDYRNDVDDLDLLAEYIDSDDEQISGDAYSHWCSATSGTCVRHIPKREIDALEFRQLPQDGGQMVDVTYATDDTWLYRHSYDRSDRTSRYLCTRIDDRADEEDLRFEPQNSRLPETDGNEYLICIG